MQSGDSGQYANGILILVQESDEQDTETEPHCTPSMDSKATEIPLTAFIQDLLPPVHPDIHIETLCDDIERGKHRLLVAKNGHLWGYSSKFPSELKTPWKTTFKALQQCARKLAQAVEPLQPTLDFRNNPECKCELSRRSFDSLPDAYFLPQDRDPQACPDWTNIAIPGVYFDRDSREYAEEVCTQPIGCPCMG